MLSRIRRCPACQHAMPNDCSVFGYVPDATEEL
jgi:hypothetical protein